jgi:hypothetical protein
MANTIKFPPYNAHPYCFRFLEAHPKPRPLSRPLKTLIANLESAICQYQKPPIELDEEGRLDESQHVYLIEEELVKDEMSRGSG